MVKIKKPRANNSIPFVLIFAALLVVAGGIMAYWEFIAGRSALRAVPGQSPVDEIADWLTYESEMGFIFKYPNDYNLPQEESNYLSLISPLNEDKDKSKDLSVQEGELKIEIVTEAGKENDSSLQCWNDHSAGVGRILGQSEIVIDDIKTTLLTWEGIGTGQFACISYGGERYLINKYPAQTTRDSEYHQILSTFKFTK